MRRSRVLGAAALALAIGLSGLIAAPATAGPAPGGEATLAPPPSGWEPSSGFHAVGTGVQMTAGSADTMHWRSLQDGREAKGSECDWTGSPLWTVRQGDWVGCEMFVAAGTQGPLKIHDYASGKTETMASQANRKWTRGISPTQVLATEKRADGWLGLHLLGRGNEPRKDVIVTTAEQVSEVTVRAFDENGALVFYRSTGGSQRLGLIDFATATMRPVPLPTGYTSPFDLRAVGMGSRWIALHVYDKVTLVSRADIAATRTLAVHGYLGDVLPVGDWLYAESGDPMAGTVAYPITGGVPRTVVPWMGSRLVAGPVGDVYVLGATSRTQWGVQRIVPDSQGVPQAKEVLPVPYRPADRMSLAMAQGDLAVGQNDRVESVQGYRTSVSGPVSVSPTPTWSCDGLWKDPVCSSAGGQANWHVPTGDGRLVALSTGGSDSCGSCVVVAHVQDTRPDSVDRHVSLASTAKLQASHIVSASGRYLLFVASENSEQRLLVADIDTGKVLDVKASSPAVLWGSVLWQPEGDKGVVSGTDLRTGQVNRRVDLGSGCRPYELQVSGDWYYSTCSFHGDGAAAYDAPAKRRIPLPFTPERHHVQLGDGYVVHQAGGGLEVTNLRSGAAVREHEVASFFHGFGSDWTIDRFGGRLAYTDAGETLHLVGVTGKASPLAVIDQDVPATVDFRSAQSWVSRWWLSKPVSSWKLTVRNKTSGISTVVRSGGEARGVIAPAWDGKNQWGAYLYTGDYEWTLTTRPADGQTPELRTSGSMKVTGIPSRAVRPPVR